MKRIYSVILLFAFLVGALQPILPMIEYQLYQGSIFELLETDICNAGHSDEMICCAINKDCTSGERDTDQNLLDTDYYPLALQITTIPKPIVLPHKSVLYLPIINNVSSRAFLPNPPPPRLS